MKEDQIMSVNGITSTVQTYDSNAATKSKSDRSSRSETQKQGITANDTAAVYEKSETSAEPKKIYKRDNETVKRLLAEAEERSKNLRNLVEKMLLKQGQTFNSSTDIYELLREGKVEVDAETKAQAEKDIEVDGYWGVDQTSERLVSFAKALTGGDPAKADEMIAAVKKGFEKATKTWGGELPGICKDTMDAAISKLEKWRDSIKNETAMESSAESSFTNQAEASKLS
jgi:hypothetical protein